MKLEPQDFEILEPMIEKYITKCFEAESKKEFEKKIFNITQTSEIMGKTYNWVDTRIKDGTLATTEDKKYVTGKVINKYLMDHPDM